MIFMVKLYSRMSKTRGKELRDRKLFVKPGGLRILRETHLRDAYFMEKGKRVYCPGELRNIYKGLAEADYSTRYGTNEQKMRAIKLRKQLEDMEQGLLRTMVDKRVSCPGPGTLNKMKEEIREGVFERRKQPTVFEKAKMRLKESLESK